MSSEGQNKFEGWGAFAPDSVQGNFKWFDYEPKEWAEDDVESEHNLTARASAFC